MKLHIRHGTSLMSRNVSWYVTTQFLSEPLLGRPVLEAIGMNTSNILTTAANKYNGLLALAHLCTNNEGGHIVQMYDVVNHSDCGVDDDNFKEDEEWINLGDDKDENWEAALQTALEDASKNGISKEERSELEHLIREFREAIRLLLNNCKPAMVKPLEIYLKTNSVPVRAGQQKYTPEKQKFTE